MLWVTLALIAALLLMPGSAGATATRIDYTVTETCTQTSPGEVTFPGGNIHIRGATLECQDVATIPQATGTNYIVMNTNLDATGNGRAWGTWRLETGEGGVWEGTWEGALTAGFVSGHGVAHGSEIYEGQQNFVSVEPGTSSGYILIPGG
jgi:hypothetical protein